MVLDSVQNKLHFKYKNTCKEVGRSIPNNAGIR